MHIPEPIFISFALLLLAILAGLGVVNNWRGLAPKYHKSAGMAIGLVAVIGLTILVGMLFSEAIYRSRFDKPQAVMEWDGQSAATQYKVSFTNISSHSYPGFTKTVLTKTNRYEMRGFPGGTYKATVSALYDPKSIRPGAVVVGPVPGETLPSDPIYVVLPERP